MNRPAAAAAAVALMAALVAGCSDYVPPSGPATPSPTVSVQQPIARWTPGVIYTTDAGKVCPKVTLKRGRLTDHQERVVLKRYGLPQSFSGPGHVAEWDHLVSLELGGGNGLRNIWPQMDANEKQRKDRLENRLHREVCAGQVALTDAQGRIMRFWLDPEY